MRCNVLIGGTDKGYIRAFVDFLTQSNQNQFNISVMVDGDLSLVALKTDQFDVYVFEEDFYLKMMTDLPSFVLPKIIVLGQPMTAVDPQKVKVLLKYQSVVDIERSIVAFHLNSTSDEVLAKSGGQAKLVTFYGPSGGSGTTTVAQIFAQQKTAKGFKVLFVSLEDLPSFHQVYHGLGTNNMSDYLVHLLSNNNWLLGLVKMISVDGATGVHYLKPANNGLDMAEVAPSIWSTWLAYMVEMSDYHYLVTDLGSRLFQGGVEVLKQSNHRVYTTRDDRASLLKWQMFQKQVEQLEGMTLLEDRTVFCSQFFRKDQIKIDSVDALLPYDSGLVKKGKEGFEHLDPQSDVYHRVGEFLNHV